MSTTTGGDIINQADRTLALDEADQAHLDEFESMLDLIRDRTRSVAEGYQVGAYLVGRPGSSKTYTVKETLERLDAPWAYRNSRMSPMGLYALLEEHPEHTVVLDDIHTLFGQDAALQILMAALGGRPGQARTVTYTTKDERKSFEFTGGIIAISNLPLGRDPLADAVASRVARLEHEPSDEMIAAFMRAQALKGFEDVTPEACLEVVEFVIAEPCLRLPPGPAGDGQGVAGLPARPPRQGVAALAGLGAVEPEAARRRRPVPADGAGRPDRLGAADRQGVVRAVPGRQGPA